MIWNHKMYYLKGQSISFKEISNKSDRKIEDDGLRCNFLRHRINTVDNVLIFGIISVIWNHKMYYLKVQSISYKEISNKWDRKIEDDGLRCNFFLRHRINTVDNVLIFGIISVIWNHKMYYLKVQSISYKEISNKSDRRIDEHDEDDKQDIICWLPKPVL